LVEQHRSGRFSWHTTFFFFFVVVVVVIVIVIVIVIVVIVIDSCCCIWWIRPVVDFCTATSTFCSICPATAGGKV
jgi:hypothetical protein